LHGEPGPAALGSEGSDSGASVSPDPGPRTILRRGSLAILAGFGAAALASKSLADDRATARALDGSPFDGAIDVGNLYGEGFTLGSGAAGLLLAGRIGGSPRLTATGQDLAQSLLVSWAAVWALKLTVNERRPNGGAYSFPSGHTATAFAAAPVIERHWGRAAGVAAYAAATATALGRLEDRRHYLADVLFGAAIGIVAGREAIGGRFAAEHLVLTPDRVGIGVRY
jgi:membrane-associated phospholipid phosphatase